jgi:hypothetical protein
MRFTILFIAASCVAAGPTDDNACCESSKPAAVAADPCCDGANKSSRGIWERLFGNRHNQCDTCDQECGWLSRLFARRSCERPMCDTCDCKNAVVSAPSSQAVVPTTIVPAAAEVAAPSATQIKTEYLNRIGKAEDYTWLTGQLFYIHAGGGLWVVRYAPVDTEDRYGGSVVLAGATNMGGYREGDLVTIHGEVLGEGRACKYLGGPLYRANDLEMIARSGN